MCELYFRGGKGVENNSQSERLFSILRPLSRLCREPLCGKSWVSRLASFPELQSKYARLSKNILGEKQNLKTKSKHAFFCHIVVNPACFEAHSNLGHVSQTARLVLALRGWEGASGEFIEILHQCQLSPIFLQQAIYILVFQYQKTHQLKILMLLSISAFVQEWLFLFPPLFSQTSLSINLPLTADGNNNIYFSALPFSKAWSKEIRRWK